MNRTSTVRYVLGFVVLLLLLGLIAFFNPSDVFTRRSSSFSAGAFMAIEPGERIEKVVERLGEPIRVVNGALGCDECRVYLFMGDAPLWMFSVTEAWVTVGPDGLVRQRYLIKEP